ncbi:hypothetical protein [Leptospira ainazelensis]|uniref:hypothetical protein n=1 Tax=Leptospira ainazelensis TaxID=2810034 RepID=UPI001E5E8193|nr:hypothetical protein [Leptospira ainazelensis]
MLNEKKTRIVFPFQIEDNDNKIDLCIDQEGTPIEAEQNTTIDPKNDPNPITRIKILSRW